MHIRAADPNDANGIAIVHVETWQYAYSGQISQNYLSNLSVTERTKGWKEKLENPEKETYAFVAENDKGIVGWCTAGVSRDQDAASDMGELHGIYVHPEHMNKGIGNELMTKALDQLRENGYKKATLWVLTSNENSRKWYEYKGWKVEGATKTESYEGIDLHETRYVIDLE